MMKFSLLCLAVLALPAIVFCVDCTSWSCLNRLYNARVERASYYTRPLYSLSGSSSGRRKRFANCRLVHSGIVVEIDRYVEGQREWLIHKGRNYGDQWDTVITDASYMSSRWTKEREKIVTCGVTVDQLMRAGRIESRYSLNPLWGPNCQTASNGIWDYLNQC